MFCFSSNLFYAFTAFAFSFIFAGISSGHFFSHLCKSEIEEYLYYLVECPVDGKPGRVAPCRSRIITGKRYLIMMFIIFICSALVAPAVFVCDRNDDKNVAVPAIIGSTQGSGCARSGIHRKDSWIAKSIESDSM